MHMRIASPPTTHSCYYGVDTPERKELLAASHDVEAMARIVGVDTLAFVSMNGLYRAVSGVPRADNEPAYCDACFSGDYPIPLTDREGGDNSAQLSLLAELN